MKADQIKEKMSMLSNPETRIDYLTKIYDYKGILKAETVKSIEKIIEKLSDDLLSRGEFMDSHHAAEAYEAIGLRSKMKRAFRIHAKESAKIEIYYSAAECYERAGDLRDLRKALSFYDLAGNGVGAVRVSKKIRLKENYLNGKRE